MPINVCVWDVAFRVQAQVVGIGFRALVLGGWKLGVASLSSLSLSLYLSLSRSRSLSLSSLYMALDLGVGN